MGNVSIPTKNVASSFFYWIKCKTRCKVTCKQELYSQNCKGRRMELTPESLCAFFWTYKYFHLLLPASRLFSFTTAKQTRSDGWLCCYKIIVSWQPMHTCLVEDTIQGYIIQNQWQAQANLEYITFQVRLPISATTFSTSFSSQYMWKLKLHAQICPPLSVLQASELPTSNCMWKDNKSLPVFGALGKKKYSLIRWSNLKIWNLHLRLYMQELSHHIDNTVKSSRIMLRLDESFWQKSIASSWLLHIRDHFPDCAAFRRDIIRSGRGTQLTEATLWKKAKLELMLLSLSAQSPFCMNPQYCLNEERAAGKKPVFHDPIWSFILVAYLNKMLGWCRGRTDRMLTDFCRQPLASSSEESTDGE